MKNRHVSMIRLCLLLVAMACPLAAAQAPPTSRPAGADGGAARGSRVMIISVDGLRPDLALLADMPTLRGLLKEGTYTFWARTTDVAITLPSHASMITGVTPARHGITWNDDGPDDEAGVRYPKYPTLFELAKRAGLTTALVGAKSKLAPLTKPGTLDFPDIPALGKGQRRADEIATRAADLVASRRPQVMMVHFADVDRAGHSTGWSGPAQVEAIEAVDRAVGKVLAALRVSGEYANTLIIVTADHGGYGRTHGGTDPRSAFIPWIAVGPGVRRGFDLTRIKEVNVRTEDTFATACHFLALTPAPHIDGRWVAAAYEQGELLQPTANAATRPARQ